jgi:antitoxin (DNA-binding transcriptional repressor) of toxin-antitoxin stability system
MKIVNMHEAKTHLSRLVDLAAKGEAFIIAKAGKPIVRVEAFVAEAPPPPRRFGFLQGQIEVPADFDTLGADEIEAMFHGRP